MQNNFTVAAIGNVFKKNKVLFFFLIGLVIVCALIYALREPLLPFLIGIVIAYLLLPVVNWIDRKLPFKEKGHDAQRVAIILVTFLVLLALLGLIAFLMLSSLSGSFAKFLANAPTLITNGLQTVGSWFKSLLRNLTPEQQKQASDIINNIGTAIGSWLQNAFPMGLSHISSTFTFVLGFMTLPFFLIFFMANIHTLSKSFYSLLSTKIAYHTRNFFKILDNVFGRYMRAQLLLGLVMGVIVSIVLLALGIDLAPALGFIAAAFQLIPTIGGALAAIIGVIVTLVVAPAKIVWVIIAYVIINFVGGTVLIAKLQGSAMNIDPSIVMVLIVIGGYLGGILGMILITPLAAILFALYKYVREEMHRSQIEEIQQT